MDLALMPDERGRGLGTAVVRALVDFVRTRRGWRRFTVDPDVDNAGGVAFWTKVGFVPVRIIEDDDGRKPYWLMEWPVGAEVRGAGAGHQAALPGTVMPESDAPSGSAAAAARLRSSAARPSGVPTGNQQR